MSKQNLIDYLLNPKNWWFPELVIFIISISRISLRRAYVYTQMLPTTEFATNVNKPIISKTDLPIGLACFQRYASIKYARNAKSSNSAIKAKWYTSTAQVLSNLLYPCINNAVMVHFNLNTK